MSSEGWRMPEEDENTIQLDQFMKYVGMVGTGGQAKIVIQGGEVRVNGVVETRRKKKLRAGDKVTFRGQTQRVEL
jgi:ribosome-associated protein